MPDDSEIIHQAIERNSAIVLSLPSAGMLRHHKSRFLQDSPDGLWIESVPAEQPLIESLIAEGKSCAISFKSGDKKVSFTAAALRLNREYRINDDTLVAALAIGKPLAVKAVQRRNNYRAKVPGDSELKLRVWRIPNHAILKDKPLKAAELPATLRDISIGGMGLMLTPKDGQAPKILVDERMRVSLTVGTDEVIIEGRLRSIRNNPDGSIAAGVQFMKLQDGLEGRRIMTELTKIVGMLQMEEVRRHRLGLS